MNRVKIKVVDLGPERILADFKMKPESEKIVLAALMVLVRELPHFSFEMSETDWHEMESLLTQSRLRRMRR